MPRLTEPSLASLQQTVMRQFSAVRLETPITKPQLAAMLSLLDGQLDAAETAALAAIPAGTEKTWLIANPAIARTLIERVAAARKETL